MWPRCFSHSSFQVASIQSTLGSEALGACQYWQAIQLCMNTTALVLLFTVLKTSRLWPPWKIAGSSIPGRLWLCQATLLQAESSWKIGWSILPWRGAVLLTPYLVQPWRMAGLGWLSIVSPYSKFA